MKSRGVHAFSNACTFLVVNAFNECREKHFNSPYELFHIPSTQPAARGQSKAYAEAVQAGNYSEQAKLVRLSSNGSEKHLYIKPSLTIGHARTDELKLRKSAILSMHRYLLITNDITNRSGMVDSMGMKHRLNILLHVNTA